MLFVKYYNKYTSSSNTTQMSLYLSSDSTLAGVTRLIHHVFFFFLITEPFCIVCTIYGRFDPRANSIAYNNIALRYILVLITYL